MTIDSPEVVVQDVPERGRPRWGRILAWAGLLALLVIVGLGMVRTQRGTVQIGHAPPDFTLTSFDGQPYRLSELKGKVVVLNFWASWCKPCEQEAADLQTAWQFYQPRGDVVFLGIDWTDTESKAQAYIQRFNITYPNGPDLGTRISQSFRTTGVPETYIVDKDGKLSYIKLSPFLSVDEIKAAVDPLLKP